ncbi:MAG: cytochrome c oxidase subunit 3 [Armatimonadetes bacterium]|nr:cytochrome c oxidase subunit 3 [Armatimonadota bacterium]
MTPSPHATVEAHDDAHHDHGPLHHHFDDMEQQRECHSLGMWAFLVTEVMMFGGLFFAYSLYRWLFPEAFHAGSEHLDIWKGTINTFVLLISSLTMALAVHAAQTRRRKPLVWWLLTTWVLGAAFLGVKAVEWTHDYHIGLIPGVRWEPELATPGAVSQGQAAGQEGHGFERPAQGEALRPGPVPETGPLIDNRAPNTGDIPPEAVERIPPVSPGFPQDRAITGDSPNAYDTTAMNQLKMYFVIYFSMTGLHAIHMIVGLLLVAYFALLGAQGKFTNGNDQPVEILGLYWHLVDIVWIFLFPLLYLIAGFHPFSGGGH